MLPWLLLAFVLVPIVELAVILEVGGLLGTGPTILLLVVDSLAGAVLVRREGRRAWQRFHAALRAARWPGDEVAQGALILLGGALLLTPGFVTDAVGLALVLAPTRILVSRLLRRRLRGRIVSDGGGVRRGTRGSHRPGSARGAGTTSHSRRPRDARRGRRETLDVEIVSVDRDRPGEQPDRPDDSG